MKTYNPYKDYSMESHVALITGGAQNIGADIALRLAGAGAQVDASKQDGHSRICAAGRLSPIDIQRSPVMIRRTPSMAVGICSIRAKMWKPGFRDCLYPRKGNRKRGPLGASKPWYSAQMLVKLNY